MTPRLVVLNGPPAVGKSTLAQRYAADHALTLNLDVDRVRDLIGGWRDDPGAAGLLARAVAVAAARAHLRAGHDVVVPQLVARPGFLEELEAVAAQAGAAFHELVLTDDRPAVLRRFADRAGTVPGAPQAGPDEVAALYDRLAAYVERRPRAVAVPAPAGAVDETYRRVLAQLGAEA
ncbi:AAA family ATPase [Jiangella sp. DSM 45060]|uniref:AAA family ATPase n=1 Tax=Jiangella sp. DSM 45060 TaxID=1798224 RepID=UPI00087A3A58|nr:AAA family ATPase [Jiangella sp. DSM 45060]SDS20872.1 AAA domain-containing protein [Jiangella sp. DSM 45060]